MVSSGISPAKIQRLDLRRQVILSGNTAGVPLGDAIEAIRERSAKVVKAMQAAGFHAANLKGGINAWADQIEPGLLRY